MPAICELSIAVMITELKQRMLSNHSEQVILQMSKLLVYVHEECRNGL